jgi:dihydrofolate synthase/folylpolyglutamate synthase
MDFTRIGRVKDVLGFSFDCPVITVGGTNGKGSTCAILETILLRAGYRVGCHTSPHLLAFNERACVNGTEATDDELLEHFEAVEKGRASLNEPVSLTYYEFTTLAILRCFALRGLDALILEVGLGGRLDAVNIINTDCAIVTSIDIDHTDYLGDTRDRIGFEKAGIFRAGKPAICGDPAPPQSLIDHAKAIGADLWRVGRDFHYEAQPGSERQQWNYVGRSQRRAALAYPALRGANQAGQYRGGAGCARSVARAHSGIGAGHSTGPRERRVAGPVPGSAGQAADHSRHRAQPARRRRSVAKPGEHGLFSVYIRRLRRDERKGHQRRR